MKKKVIKVILGILSLIGFYMGMWMPENPIIGCIGCVIGWFSFRKYAILEGAWMGW